MQTHKHKVLVIGGGSWATANIKMLEDNATEKEIFWWMRNPVTVEHLQKFRHNPTYLSSVEVKVPAQHISNDLKYLIAQADIIILNVPAAFLKDAFQTITPNDLAGKKIVSAIKGIVPDENMIIGDFMHEHYQVPFSNFVVLDPAMQKK